MSRPRAFPVATRVPAPVYAELEAAAAARLTTISTITRDFLTAAHLSGAFAAHLAAQLTAPVPNPTGLTAPSAAPAAPTKAHVPNPPGISDELRATLDNLFGDDDEPAAPAPAHTASTPAPPAAPSAMDLAIAADPQDWLTLDGAVPDLAQLEQLILMFDTPEKFERHKARERQRANTLTPEQTLARIAEGMAAVRSQPGHGYIEPYVRVDHAPKREPLTDENSSQLPEPGTPAWVAMAERQGLPPAAIAEVVFATAPEKVSPPVPSGSFDFDAMGD